MTLNTPTSLNAFAPSFTPSSGMVPRHGHSMSLAGPSFKSPNPFGGSPNPNPSLFIGSFNPFGQGATLGGDTSLSVSPQPPTSLASVSEYEEEEEQEEEKEEEEEVPERRRIYAPRPSRDRLDLHAPVLAATATPPPAKSETPPPPMTAVIPHSQPAIFGKVAPAKTLSTTDFMRGFGIEDEDEEEEEEEQPIVNETQREKILAEEGPTPTAPRFPDTEGDRIERAVSGVDPADDADEEDTQTEDEDADAKVEEEEEEGSHSRHVSIAPSLVEMGAPGRGFKDFKFGGRDELREEDVEEEDVPAPVIPDTWGSFGGGAVPAEVRVSDAHRDDWRLTFFGVCRAKANGLTPPTKNGLAPLSSFSTAPHRSPHKAMAIHPPS